MWEVIFLMYCGSVIQAIICFLINNHYTKHCTFLNWNLRKRIHHHSWRVIFPLQPENDGWSHQSVGRWYLVQKPSLQDDSKFNFKEMKFLVAWVKSIEHIWQLVIKWNRSSNLLMKFWWVTSSSNEKYYSNKDLWYFVRKKHSNKTLCP